MRVTIVPSDFVVVIDGLALSDIDMSSIDVSIHAVQWYGNNGEVEIKDPTTGKMVDNATIDTLNAFNDVIAQFYTKKAEQEAAIAAIADIEQIHEV